MKKFNIRKWKTMQKQKAELHQIYRNASDNFDYESEVYSRKFQHFASSHKDCDTALAIINSDAKTLSAVEIDNKIHEITHDWAAICKDLNISKGFIGKHALTELYKQLHERQKSREIKDQAAEAQENYGRCFNQLEEFASKHGKGDKTVYSPAPDAGLIA
ncbi:hypothetical protein Q9L42_010495 [Methylomarinum sp. Ch1-1]|uniref:Uncharacterized protein n=1 Tax=Methylomarinum roseum TaxID=3067653 RepID=A0AAU7NPA8_9GAMM|nr:hypothetical protein [Methylomarinum sp. Ch1-1]MDP4521315.1 hypothetical protein [Methylomarinum sp. Ch1-1]